jgi:hypothetical protein
MASAYNMNANINISIRIDFSLVGRAGWRCGKGEKP